jgi:PAS domain S-box-containing protein
MKQIDYPIERENAREPLEGELLNAIIDTVDALLIILDEQGRIVRFNRACENLTGYAFDEVHGKVFWDFLLPQEDIPVISGFFENPDFENVPKKRESYWLAKSGERRLISWSNTTIKNALNEVRYVVGTGVYFRYGSRNGRGDPS